MNTKIIATIGTYTEEPLVFFKLVEAGMHIVRMNFSHATPDQYLRVKKLIAAAEKKFGRKLYLMLDLCGPRIRVAKMPEDGKPIEVGKTYVFSAATRDLQNSNGTIGINDPYLYKDLKPGQPFYLANGIIALRVTKIDGTKIFTEAEKGGVLFSNKGINVPETYISRGGLTKKDMIDARFGMDAGFDFIAMSFVQTAADIKKLRKLLGVKGETARIIAKIERPIALENIDEIVRSADAIMIARGDLSVEVPLERIPLIQKDLIRHAHWYGKPAIVATQMMMTMIHNPRPSCAEVSDVANAVYQGADAVMLSDETAVGKYPVDTVATVRRIIETTEDYKAKPSLFK